MTQSTTRPSDRYADYIVGTAAAILAFGAIFTLGMDYGMATASKHVWEQANFAIDAAQIEMADARYMTNLASDAAEIFKRSCPKRRM